MKLNPAILVLLLLAASGGGRKKAATEPDDDDDDDVDQGEDKDAEPFCEPGVPYLAQGDLKIPQGGAQTYKLTPAEYSAAMTILTRVINFTYVPDFETGTQLLCNAKMVGAAAGVGMSESQALAMLAYWKIRDRALDPGEKLSRYPTLDPVLKGNPQNLAEWTTLMSNLRSFYAAAWKKATT